MKTAFRCFALVLLGTALLPTAAHAQFGFFGGPSFGYYSPFGYGVPYGGLSYPGFGHPGFGYPGYTYPGYGYGPYYSATYIAPLVYTASTATALPRMRSAVYPAIPYRTSPAEGTRAYIDLHVPAAGAQVWFDGVLTQQTGIDRHFITPPLEPGASYTFEIRASWRGMDGKQLSRLQRVDIRAGDQRSVNFTAQP
jgi:uncharacterized protein (TIGR03000 family)